MNTHPPSPPALPYRAERSYSSIQHAVLACDSLRDSCTNKKYHNSTSPLLPPPLLFFLYIDETRRTQISLGPFDLLPLHQVNCPGCTPFPAATDASATGTFRRPPCCTEHTAETGPVSIDLATVLATMRRQEQHRRSPEIPQDPLNRFSNLDYRIILRNHEGR